MTEEDGHVFLTYEGSGVANPPKNVPELIAQAGPFLLTIHKAHDAFSFRRSDVAQGLALLAQEKQVSLSLKDHEVQDFVETMRCAA